MIHYHGTPMGGAREQRALALTGRDVLIPFLRPDDLSLALQLSRRIILDNSAFSYWKQGHGEYPCYEQYVDWVRPLLAHEKVDFCFIPDHIAGSPRQNDAYLSRWPADLAGRGVPVYHMHQPVSRLVALAQQYEHVGLGGGQGYEVLKSGRWWTRIHEMMQAVTDDAGRPLCHLHGLRMLDPKVFTQLPLSSGDSTNVARNSGQVKRFEKTEARTRGERAILIADRIESYGAAGTYGPKSGGAQLQLGF